MFTLLLALGFFLNGLIVFANKGMPVQNLKASDGIHIPMNSNTRFSFLGDLSIFGFFSVGDLLVVSALWTRIFPVLV